ncbi:MAG: HK97 family phage prohead protease [Planctomycetota bacterium]
MPHRFITADGDIVDQPAAGLRSHSEWGGEARAIDRDRRTVTAPVSTPAIDSYGERVLPEAFDLKRFRSLPRLIANHTYQLPDGRTGQIGEWTDIGNRDGELVGTCQFFDTPLGLDWWEPIDKTGRAAFSVGWLTRKDGWALQPVEGDDGTKRRVRTYIDVELIEVSAVTVPSNPETILAVNAGFGRRSPVSVAWGEPGDLAELLNRWGEKLDDFGELIETIEFALRAEPGSKLHQLLLDTVKAVGRVGAHGPQGRGVQPSEAAPEAAPLRELGETVERFRKRAS